MEEEAPTENQEVSEEVLHIPNSVTIAAMNSVDLIEFDSIESLFEELRSSDE